jgi:SpoVK/Ycf46/Vps4 family AAA+-type ATPase
MAVLATNLSKNIDDAFARRTQYVVEFPFPDEALRRGIWERAFPDRAPLDDGVEIPLLARSFELAGGSIKGAALAAATLAARDGGVITMDHIALAVAREYQKLGRLPSQSEFGRYYGSVLEQLGSGA